MTEPKKASRLTRRGVMAGLGVAGVALAHSATKAFASTEGAEGSIPMGSASQHLTVATMGAASENLKEGDWVQTLGFHSPGDGGGALYQIQKRAPNRKTNGADTIPVGEKLMAVLHEREEVNYRMFGAVGDGKNDDGVQIKLAHEYANEHDIPVISLSGEFWIIKTNGIPIKTNVQLGKTIVHIDERHNQKRVARFNVRNDEEAQVLTTDEKVRKALLKDLKPGVQIIEALAPYAGCLFSVRDNGDRIGIRAGYKGNKGWAREELFYVEEEGRIIGEIAWTFRDFTSIRAIPTNRNFIVIEGGSFVVSGHSPEGSTPGYHSNGFSVQRSRTIIREQWVGLKAGSHDNSLEPRSGFYSLGNVYDVTLENIRLMPWEKNRRPPKTDVKHGTYGISGARMLNCTYRNLTADAGWVSWGVFGTNLNKNFRIEKCHLNRIDVHFHCWNLYISDCKIGFKGISITGGGELIVENTTRDGNHFLNFRRDYGAKWDGPIRMRNCTLRPTGKGRVSVLYMVPSDFDYKYPIGFGTSIAIEDLRINYAIASESADDCWLMYVAPFSQVKAGPRLFFPHSIVFRDIAVENRQKGVKLISLPDPWHYDVRREGGCDDNGIRPNCDVVCERVHLDKATPGALNDASQAQLVLGGTKPENRTDPMALYPRMVFTDCRDVALLLRHSAASASFQRCSINMLSTEDFAGELSFFECRFQANASKALPRFFCLDSTLGTRLTSCTLEAPVVNGKATPALIDRLGFIEINKSVRYNHLNTALGREVLKHYKKLGLVLAPEWLSKLQLNQDLDI